MNVIISILIIVLIAVAAWNWFSLNTLKKLAKQNESPITDAKYFELKYNIQFLVGLSTVLITVVGLLGYNTVDDLRADLRSQAKESIDTMEVKLKQISDILKSKESSSVELNNRIIQIAADAKEVEKAIREVKSLEEKIKRINERNILKQNYYIVPSISYSLKDAEKKFYLKDLITNTGDKLPIFNTPPLIFATQDLNQSVQIFNVTTDSFTIVWTGGIALENSKTFDLNEPSKFSLLVIEK